MNNSRILLTVFVLWLSATVFVSPLKADHTADSIRMEMKNLTGEHLLQAHSNLCRLAAGQNDLEIGRAHV